MGHRKSFDKRAEIIHQFNQISTAAQEKGIPLILALASYKEYRLGGGMNKF